MYANDLCDARQVPISRYSSPFITLCLVSIGMDHVIRELYYILRLFYQEIIVKIIPRYKFHGKKKVESSKHDCFISKSVL